MRRLRSDFVDQFFTDHIHVDLRTIYMGSFGDNDGAENGVDYLMSEKAVKALFILDRQAPDGDKPITIILNSPGGDVNHGLAVYDAIKSCKNKTSVVVYGRAMSMASVLLQAANERILKPSSVLMVHYGTFSIETTSQSAINWAKEEERINRWMEDVYLEKIREKHPRFTRDKLKELLKADTILPASEAIELGLADRIEE